MLNLTLLRPLFAACALALLAAAPVHAMQDCNDEPALAKLFDQASAHGTFVLLDGQTGELICHDSVRAEAGFLPASTFKIPNTVIALETGVASGADFGLPWDSRRDPRQDWWPETWARDQTLATALPNSVVWFYQALARRIGTDRMQAYVDKFDYGNRNIQGDIDRFWLTGDLRISALQQVKFLQRFYTEALGASHRSTQIVKEALVLEHTDEYRYSGKTGWAGMGDAHAQQTGWLVGYLERKNKVYFYALNMDMNNPGDGPARLAIVKAILQQRGLMPAAKE
ncbi:penicillin-binding transpeptidase domain-containing protein [Allopusillimonas ginsengisoli]|uniref:penicillin-binding transpeptidase domain-containing protein n=1 Tax=Allopusillimonas ginsengisoli TaxID=453575 RepID=UPI00101F4ED0|nr:penicillin-binding transpeptidase domain-containing protein [Allopusillimonas ginsengisoli]TEA77185.1 class D beta-lactamase [Allopusillimonas ginsengisoli]